MKRALILSLIFVLGLSQTTWAIEDQMTEDQLEEKLKEIDKKIEATKTEMARVKDADFLPNLYFALAELYTDKSRTMYLLKIEKNGDTPANELDFTAEKRPKQEAIELYQKVYSFFTKYERRDRALFYKAHEHRELGQQKQMVETYMQLMQEFPDSPYYNESNIVMGDFTLEDKKDIDGALEFFKKVINRPLSPFTPVAHYRSGWCYINKSEWLNAFKEFEKTIDLYQKVDISSLPELYKKNDLRREATVAMVNPYVELFAEKNKEILKRGHDPIAYYREKSDSFMTYQKALARLSRRLLLKNLWPETADAYLELLKTSQDHPLRVDAIMKFYQAFKKAPLRADLVVFTQQVAEVNFKVKNDTRISAKEKKVRLKNFEIIARDVATTLHKRAMTSKLPEDYNKAITAYDIYEWGFPDSPKIPILMINKAESAFNADRLVEAGIWYEWVSKSPKIRQKKDYAESSIQAYVKALQNVDKLSPVHLLQARRGLREVGATWLSKNPRHPGAPTTQFNIAQSWYDEREFDTAVKSFLAFISKYPNDSRKSEAILLIINSYSQKDDYPGLERAAARLVNTPGLSAAEKTQIRDAIRAAQLKQIQAKAGEFGTKEYAANLKEIANKFKGKELGDAALYEAFVSLRSRRDEQAYNAGEALLAGHASSQYTKEVVASMAQMALTTADFDRASRYFEAFSSKYPNEKESTPWLTNAASMREWMGDYEEAKTDYTKLGNAEAAARMDFLGNNWASLERTAARVPGLKGNYWRGLAAVRQGRFAQAAPVLRQVASAGGGDGEARDMVAHAAYLLSQDSLNKFKSIQMRDANDQAALQAKIKGYQSLSNELNRVVKMGSGRWTIAALYGLGQANYSLGEFIEKSPTPAGLSGAQLTAYQKELSKQAASYKQQSKQFFDQCLTTSEKFEVFTRFVNGCLARGTMEVDEAKDTMLRTKRSNNEPSQAAAIRKKLYDKPRDVNTLQELAGAYMSAGDYAMAGSVLNRALEIDPKNSKVQASLGVTYLFMNDTDRGYAELKKALQLNSREPIALWHIAGLYKEFKFRGKLASALAKAKATPKPRLAHPMLNSL